MIEAAKDIADARVERALYERATGYEHPDEKVFCQGGEIIRVQTVKRYPCDVTACIFWLQNRRPQGWRDKQEVQHSGELSLASAIEKARRRFKSTAQNINENEKRRRAKEK